MQQGVTRLGGLGGLVNWSPLHREIMPEADKSRLQ